MGFKRQNRDPLVLKSLPSSVKLCEESGSLPEKLALRIEWMQKHGIDSRVKKTKRPLKATKSPRPGTLIYFSSVS